MSTFALFPIPCYLNKISFNEKELGYVKDREFYRVDANNGYISSTYQILDEPEMKRIRNDIMSHVNKFIYDDLKYDSSTSMRLLQSWIMKHEKGDFSGSHFHSNSIISGVYYLDVVPEHGAFYIHRDESRPYVFPAGMMVDRKEMNILNCDAWSFVPTPGELILFPSHMKHYTDKSDTDKERYCIAFNVYIEGDLSNSSRELHMLTL